MIFLWLSLLAAAAFVGGRLTPANCAPPTASAAAHYGGYAATATIAGGVLLLAMMWLMNAITAAPLPSSIAYAAPLLILATGGLACPPFAKTKPPGANRL